MNTVPEDTTNSASARRIALFPGAFRPPHRAHEAALRHLVEQGRFDEIFVIVTNRFRHLPGTTLMLEPSVAEKVWRIYAKSWPRVHVEVAPGSGVAHALSFFERANRGDHLVFCLGESDFGRGDPRFEKIHALSESTGVSAEIVAAPTATLPGRATEVRKALAQGPPGRSRFFAALPDDLSIEAKEDVWRICQDGLRDVAAVAGDRIRAHFVANELGTIEALEPVRPDKTDPVFRVEIATGRRLVAKVAIDTVEGASYEDRAGLKPRVRLSVERRALEWLGRRDFKEARVPRVVHFDREAKVLVTDEIPWVTLEASLSSATWDERDAIRVARFLARCHRDSEGVAPMWGQPNDDAHHWAAERRRRVLGPEIGPATWIGQSHAEELFRMSEDTGQRCLLHLDVHLRNVLCHENEVGIVDWERASGFGDPAADVGFFLGELLWKLGPVFDDDSIGRVTRVVAAYREEIGKERRGIVSRMLPFAGAAIRQRVAIDSTRERSSPSFNRRKSMGRRLLKEIRRQGDHPERRVATILKGLDDSESAGH